MPMDFIGYTSPTTQTEHLPSRPFGSIQGSVVIIGFGSIGRGTLPLLRRHFSFDESHLVVIDPSPSAGKAAKAQGARWLQEALTAANYEAVLHPLLASKGSTSDAVVVNLSVDVSSLDIMKFCRKHNVIYIDTVVEPWPGVYFNAALTPSERSNYALREQVLEERRMSPGGRTAVSCCGANPGMVSWFVKQALLNLAHDLGVKLTKPSTRDEWGRLMQRLGVKGVHIAERDTQRRLNLPEPGCFVNTWSVDGFVSESLQPAELGWGTHEKQLPQTAFHQRLLGIAYDYDVGDVVVHKHLGQLGVVVDQLPICFESDEWIQSHLGSVSDARVFHPWYIIAVAHHENVPLDFTRYGSQLSHRLVSKKMSIGLHRLLPLFFEGYDPGTGKYLPRKRRQSVASEPVKDSDIDLFEAHRVKLAINPMAVQQC